MASGEVKVSTMTFLADVPDDAKIYVVKPGETTPYYTTKAALLADIAAGTPPNLQAVVTQGGVVISTDGLKKVEIDKDNGQIKISTRPTTGDAWVVRAKFVGGVISALSPDGSVENSFDYESLKLQSSSALGPTEYKNDRIIYNLPDDVDDFISRILLLPTAYGIATDGGPYEFQKLALKPILNSYDFTAELGVDYETDQDLTVGDPDDQIGSYRVFVSNNTATIGGVAYPKGSRIYRYYDGTAWHTVQFIDKDYVDAEINNAVAGLLDDRGNHNASSNLFPSTGGSGSGGAILKGDLWTISVAGTLGGVAVTVGDVVRALVDTPGQTATNWVITENNIGYVPENIANKTDTMSGNTASSVKFLSAKGVYDWVTSILVSATSSVDGIAKLYTGLGSNTDGSMTQKAISDELALRSKNVVNIITPSSAITGTTSETQVTAFNFVIPANTFSSIDMLKVETLAWEKVGTANASTCRLKLSNTNNYAAASNVLILAASGGNVTMKGTRTYKIAGGNLKGLMSTAANGIFNDNILTNVAHSTIALDVTQPIYGFVSLQITNGADSVTMNELVISKL